jgi:hypothetical protein
MMTVKELKAVLSHLPDNAIVKSQYFKTSELESPNENVFLAKFISENYLYGCDATSQTYLILLTA